MKSTWQTQLLAANQQIANYIQSKLALKDYPIYSSVDMRDAGFKAAIVDTNLFPAGFNNLFHTDVDYIGSLFKKIIQAKAPNATQLLFIIEDNTRNEWYLEHVHILKKCLESANYHVTLAALLEEYPETCRDIGHINLTSKSGAPIRVNCINRLAEQPNLDEHWDCIILNNDLIRGIPSLLTKFSCPIFPSLKSGWHHRKKSTHFSYVNQISDQLSTQIDIDPWLIGTLFDTMQHFNIQEQTSIDPLKEKCSRLFKKMQQKYSEYEIDSPPFLIIKADSGSYGMGVISIRSVDELSTLNRKARNKMMFGKNKSVISDIIIQEGVPTMHTANNHPAEPCLYYVGNQYAGSFLRTNELKKNHENLNSLGMKFLPFEPSHEIITEANNKKTINDQLTGYKILTNIALLAVTMEELE